MRAAGLLVFALAALTLTACAPVAHKTEPVSVPDVPEPVIVAPAPQTPGSLWTTGNGSLFVDNRACRVGDILTVIIQEQAEANKEASTSTGRSTSASADITSLFGLESNIANINSAIDPTKLISAGYTNDFQGSGTTTRREDLVATITTQVVEVLPNGNMRIAGSKRVTVNHEQQLIHLTGVVRQQDITPQNEIDSQHILDANIVYTGNGVIDDKQKPGWLLRLLDSASPF
ncbi:MAG: flagellar basal body L-ring protein FlgH [Desulfuromonadaceae bacterium]|nr:flagellar basal body L-ring protein FlgH [Desulfuromonadaceae bacterium]